MVGGRPHQLSNLPPNPHVTLAPVTGAEQEGGAKGAGGAGREGWRSRRPEKVTFKGFFFQWQNNISGAYNKFVVNLHKDQTSKLQAKNQQELDLLDDIRNFMKQKAAIEKHYAEGLLKLSSVYGTKKIAAVNGNNQTALTNQTTSKQTAHVFLLHNMAVNSISTSQFMCNMKARQLAFTSFAISLLIPRSDSQHPTNNYLTLYIINIFVRYYSMVWTAIAFLRIKE